MLAHRYVMVRSIDVVSALRWPPATGRVVHELLLSGAARDGTGQIASLTPPLVQSHTLTKFLRHSEKTVLQSLTTDTQICYFLLFFFQAESLISCAFMMWIPKIFNKRKSLSQHFSIRCVQWSVCEGMNLHSIQTLNIFNVCIKQMENIKD